MYLCPSFSDATRLRFGCSDGNYGTRILATVQVQWTTILKIQANCVDIQDPGCDLKD
jgi:hypothetical protein